jgi:hypothetical protein
VQNVQAHPHPQIHIVVEVDGKNKEVTFAASPVTGREIREKAGAPPSDDLTRLVDGKPSGGNIGIDEKVGIRGGERFLALPAGTVS